MDIYYIVDTSLVVGINRFAIKCHNIGLVRREIDILDTTLSLDFIIELNGAAIGCL